MNEAQIIVTKSNTAAEAAAFAAESAESVSYDNYDNETYYLMPDKSRVVVDEENYWSQ